MTGAAWTAPRCAPCALEELSEVATKLYRMTASDDTPIPLCPKHAFTLKTWAGELVDIADA